MTPEQKDKLNELLQMLEANRDAAVQTLTEKGPEALAEWRESMEESSKDIVETMETTFATTPTADPLLALAITQVMGANLTHVLHVHEDCTAEDKLSNVVHVMMGCLEAIIHTVLEAERPEKDKAVPTL